MALGDTFVEVISPVEEDAATARHLQRLGGDGGYMAMFQVDDIAAARERIDRLGLRVIYELDRDGDTDIHLHPVDVPGAIVAIDRMEEPGSWRWAGPAWIAKAPAEIGPVRVTGATLTAREPEEAGQHVGSRPRHGSRRRPDRPRRRRAALRRGRARRHRGLPRRGARGRHHHRRRRFVRA